MDGSCGQLEKTHKNKTRKYSMIFIVFHHRIQSKKKIKRTTTTIKKHTSLGVVCECSSPPVEIFVFFTLAMANMGKNRMYSKQLLSIVKTKITRKTNERTKKKQKTAKPSYSKTYPIIRLYFIRKEIVNFSIVSKHLWRFVPLPRLCQPFEEISFVINYASAH